jgi:uncharacterized protein (TIGR00369 family)
MTAVTDTEILELIKGLYAQHIPFHQLIGLEVLALTAESVALRVRMKPELEGNPFYHILHGGVTASLLDAAGGMVAMANLVVELLDLSPEEMQRRLQKLGTIDIRIDYLRPGRGDAFIATARVIRKGNKVAVTRMELHNEAGLEIALGTATYLVG